MNAAERRTKITELLAASDRPMSATALAARWGGGHLLLPTGAREGTSQGWAGPGLGDR